MSVDFLRNYEDQSHDVLVGLLDQSQDCIKLIGLDGTLEYMNPNGQRALGIVDFASVIGKDWRELWPSESADQIAASIDAALRGQRSRFEGYCPTASGEPRWWDVSVSPISDRAGNTTHILATSRDVTTAMQDRIGDRLRREEAERTAAHSDDVASEMRHRLKNLLAVVGSINRLLVGTATDAQNHADRMQERLHALAKAQDIASQKASEAISLDQAIPMMLGQSGGGERIFLGQIPALPLVDQEIQTLALLLGELQTNSLKYGALRDADGSVSLTFVRKDRLVSMHWQEECAHRVEPSDREGAGFRLIKRLGSGGGCPAQVNWLPYGLAVDVHVSILG